jgi:hypothetical protein
LIFRHTDLDEKTQNDAKATYQKRHVYIVVVSRVILSFFASFCRFSRHFVVFRVIFSFVFSTLKALKQEKTRYKYSAAFAPRPLPPVFGDKSPGRACGAQGVGFASQSDALRAPLPAA